MKTATHSSTFAWEIPWTEELGGLQTVGLQRGGHELETEHAQVILMCRGSRNTAFCLHQSLLALLGAVSFSAFMSPPASSCFLHKVYDYI